MPYIALRLWNNVKDLIAPIIIGKRVQR